MIDIHSHILPGIDDGSKEIEMSIQILKEARQAGVRDIILTPHYIQDYYENTKEKVETLLPKLQAEIEKEQIDINLYPGNEIYITPEMHQLVKEGIVTTLNNSKYVLFELPMQNHVVYVKDMIFNLLALGYIPVIAHPERYTYVQENPNMLYELIEIGALFQSNIGSVLGAYGKKEKATALLLLKHHMIHFLASDTHRPNTFYPKIEEVFRQLEKQISKTDIQNLLEQNPRKILENGKIEIEEPIPIKKGIFGYK